MVFVIFMLVLVAGNVIINISLFKEYYMRQAKKRMLNTSLEIKRVYTENEEIIQNYIEMIDGTWGIWVRIADDQGNLLYTSKPERNKDNKLSEWAVKTIQDGKKAVEEEGVYYSEIIRDENNIVRLVCLTSMKEDNHEVYIILTRSIKSVYENINTANRLVEGTAFVLFVVGLIFISYLSISITKPILDISEHAKEIANLNFSKKLPVKNQNEIGTLANAINDISDKLSLSIENLKSDIDDRKALVRNMSHELKTPISAIKGYTEGLKYAVANTPEKMDKYCDVIITECNKMDYLIKQMLELSAMETIGIKINKETFQIKHLIESIRMCFDKRIESKNINFKVYGDEEISIYADYHLIERATFNLIENAIRYTNMDGEIIFTFYKENEGVFFSIFNSGSTIPESELNNIWKVFYKTDKSRTRGSNNYGIGLSIVKENISLHEGIVSVENKNEGVEFSFWIPDEVEVL